MFSLAAQVVIVSKAESTPRAELSGADDLNKRREGMETQKSSFRPGRVLLLVDVIGAGNLGSWCGHSLNHYYFTAQTCILI